MSDDSGPGLSFAPADEAAYHLAAIVDSSDDAIVSKDLNGTIRSWNRAAERLFGYTSAEAVGNSIRIIIPPDRQGEEDQVLQRIRAGLKVEHFETVRRRKDGSEIEIALTVSPVRDATGRVIGASKIARDISERRAAEEALRKSVELKDQFLSMISHELRTPIAIVVGNGRLLLRRGDQLPEEEKHKSIVDITEQSERLQRIIENLLALTRLEAGDEVELRRFDLAELTASVVDGLRAREGAPDISGPAGPAPLPAVGEPTLVTLMIENLVRNALKYSPAGGSVEVELFVAAEGRPAVRVLDRGMGIADSSLPHIFEPFYRGDEAPGVAGGMGIGLAVCKKLSDAQHGTIWAEPRDGGGTIMAFSIPATFTVEASPESKTV